LLILVRQGTKYSEDYVNLLKRQALETSGLETLVLGDQSDADIPLRHDFPGWWSKCELLRPDIPRPFIYVDLDSYILGDISPLLGTDLIAREWHPNWKACGKYQTSIFTMSKYRPEMWEAFMERPNYWMNNYYGDQKFFEKFEWDYIQEAFPDMVGSYKFHNKERPVNKIVTFHGKPKMPDTEGWAKDIWINR